MNAKFDELKSRLAEVQDLTKVAGVLHWDQQTMMSPRGASARAEQIATVTKVAYEKFTDPALGELLEELQSYGESHPYDSDEASLIRVARRDYAKAAKVPSTLRAEIARAGALARDTWIEARKKSDYAIFLPYLTKNVDLKQQYVACLADEQKTSYDILLDDYEPEMKTAEVQACFDELKQALIPLIASIREREDAVSDQCLHRNFPVDKQTTFCWHVVEQLGADPNSWRLDPTVHPFAGNSAIQDIRITTRYYDDFLNPALFGSMHEFGHGLYEHQVSPDLERTPLCRGASLGLHESQSRMWENLVGRGRPFWEYMYPQLQQTYTQQLGDVSLDEFYRAVNKVQPSLIRVEADEATYCLHIIIRFELEQEIMAGDIPLVDLPAAWNERYRDYLGVDVPNDALGVLQDIHWSGGMIGYFPTYALGSIIASQIWEKIQLEIPDLDDRLRHGEFGALRTWLRDHLHRYGRKFTPAEMLERIVGTSIQVEPYMRYLTNKFSEIYEL